jgi:hypothetical protein
MGKGTKAPKAPSYKAEQKAAKKLADTASKNAKINNRRADAQLKHFQKQAIPDRANTERANQGLYQTAGLSGEFQKNLQERYQNVFQPLEDDLIQEYRDYASPERYDLNRGRAMADVSQQYEAARKNATRELESYGVNPAATRYAALDLDVRTKQAAAAVAAANQADQQTDATRRALRTEAIGYGQKLPGFADQAADTATVANNSAVANTLNTTKTEGEVQGTAPQYAAIGANYLGVGTQANNSAVAAKNAQTDAEMAAFKADQESSSGWGDALGLVAGLASKAFLAADGGAIPAPNAVPKQASPSGGKAIDDVNAKLTAGEFVLPEDVTRWLGEEKLQKMILKAREAKTQAGAKPTVGKADPGPVTYRSQPGVGAIPMRG